MQTGMHTVMGAMLQGCRVVVVEDEYLLASCLTAALIETGATVIGPVGTVSDAHALISAEPVIHGAILDLNLHGKMTFDVADELITRGIAFIFTTGHDRSILPEWLRHIDLCQKPFSIDMVLHAVARAIQG